MYPRANSYSTLCRQHAPTPPPRLSLPLSLSLLEVWNIYELFHTRYSLHKRAYQHRVSNCIELMLTEVLVMANDHFKVTGRDGVLCRMSEAIDDMVAYSKVSAGVGPTNI